MKAGINMKSSKLGSSYLIGIVGSLLLFFVGWEFNIPLMAWVSFPLLVFSFRSIPKWQYTVPLIPLIAIVKFTVIHGGWSLGLLMEIAFSVIVSIPLIASLYLDRAYCKHLNPLLATLIFPCTYTILDYLLIYANIGTTFSLADSQSTFLGFIQIVSIFGSWFAGFIVAWFAPVAVLFLTNLTRLKSVWRPLVTYFTILSVIMLFGGSRLVLNRPQSQTVRVASITAPFDQDYWSITDKGTPRDDAEKIKPQMAKIQDELFTMSKKAVDYGAKVIFWSEGNYPVYEDDYSAFLDKAKSFARENNVYFMPSCVEFLYGQSRHNNLANIINPRGELEYRYEKTISWYPSNSDGKIPVINTPYGKISAAICFDMDFPSLISQAKDADIMLVPGYDTKKIADYHTRVSFLRGIENGFSVVRQANEGASISADYMGNTLAYQNYYNTDSRIMISDVPAKGEWTFYGFTGEIFLWLVLAGFVCLNVWYLRKQRNGSAVSK